MKQISVIIGTYNRCESLRDTIRALKQQIYSSDLQVELFAVDNNSNDKTEIIVREEAQGSPFPIYYFFEESRGTSFARNRGVHESKGEILIFTDDDTIPNQDWIQKIVDNMSKYDADCIGGRILPLWIKTPPDWLFQNEVLMGSLATNDGRKSVLIAQSYSDYDPQLIYGANMAFKRACLDAVGLFDVQLGPHGKKNFRGEESELIERLLKHGKKVVYIPDAVVKHKVEPKRMKMSYFRSLRFHAGRSQVMIYPEKWGILPKWLICECISNAFFGLLSYIRRLKSEAIKFEMLFWFQLGVITENIRRRFRSFKGVSA